MYSIASCQICIYCTSGGRAICVCCRKLIQFLILLDGTPRLTLSIKEGENLDPRKTVTIIIIIGNNQSYSTRMHSPDICLEGLRKTMLTLLVVVCQELHYCFNINFEY